MRRCSTCCSWQQSGIHDRPSGRGSRHHPFFHPGGVRLQLCGLLLRGTRLDDPIAGSAYTYAYTTLGEIFAWIIGWDLILEYAVSNMSVAVGFSAYFNDICDFLFHTHLPDWLVAAAYCRRQNDRREFSTVPALLIVLILT